LLPRRGRPCADKTPCRRRGQSKATLAAIDKDSVSSSNENRPLMRCSALAKAGRGALVMQSGRKSSCRFLILVLAGAVCPSIGSRSAHATGCHVPDRPVLAHTFSWERWQSSGISHQGAIDLHGPPAVRRLPCQGEIPTLPTQGYVSLVPALAAVLSANVPARGEPAVIRTARCVPLKFVSRLDRPPRLAWA
jgi:hypothetical protein